MGRFIFFRKKERWTATILGQLLKLLVLLSLIVLFIKTIHPFLAEINPVETKTMVLEGFVPDYVVEQAVKIFLDGNYEQMLITGKPRIKGSHLDHYDNDGEYTAATLDKMGFDMTKVSIIPIKNTVTKDRTYESGKEIKNYLNNLPEVQSFNLVSIGCHARRSRYLFEESFNNSIDIGIIAINNTGYDANEWWHTSVGFRQVMQETIAWIYARFFFFP